MALLMTLLLVVGCDDSPISNIHNQNGLVVASISVGGVDSRGISITGIDKAIDYFRVALIPEWDTLDNGASIYGQIGSRDENGIVSVAEKKYSFSESIPLGYVTPGKWTVYVYAYNKNNQRIMEGFSSAYFSSSNSNLNIALIPCCSGDNGYIEFTYLYLQKLSSDHNDRYLLKFNISAPTGIEINGSIKGVYQELNGMYLYSQWNDGSIDIEEEGVKLTDSGIEVAPGQYIISISLIEKTGNSTVKNIGGFTKVINVVPGVTSHISGGISPSEFKEVGIDFSIPSVSASIITPGESYQDKNKSMTFTCSASSYDTSNFNRIFIWFIDGETITSTGEGYLEGQCNVTAIGGDESSGTSSLSCTFLNYGKREVRCEVVYIPKSSSGTVGNTPRYIGSATSVVQIVPRGN